MAIFGNFSVPMPDEINVFKIVKSDFTTASDITTIEAFFNDNNNAAQRALLKHGDIAILYTVDPQDQTETEYPSGSYIYTVGTSGRGTGVWQPLVGEINPESIRLSSDITLAGNYTQVGNIVKGAYETGTYEAAGKTLAEVLDDIFNKRLQPSIIEQPSIGDLLINFPSMDTTMSNISVTVPAVQFNEGQYSFDATTGVSVTAWKVERLTNKDNGTWVQVATTNGTTDTFNGAGVEWVKYKTTATYSDGAVAKDNYGEASSPEVKIVGGSLSTESNTGVVYTPVYYGMKATVPTAANIDEAYVLALTPTTVDTGEEKAIPVTGSPLSVVFAAPATLTLEHVYDVNTFNMDIVFVFNTADVTVNGVAYKAYWSENAIGLADTTYNVVFSAAN